MRRALLAASILPALAQAACPDGLCDGGETKCTCPADCWPACGDGCCSPFLETECSCAADCAGTSFCGDVCCTASEAGGCPADCAACDADGTCDAAETPCCLGDACSNHLCNDACCDATESACDCPSDCPPSCGDGCCTDPEGCTSCPADCGPCVESGPEPAAEPVVDAGGDPVPDAAIGNDVPTDPQLDDERPDSSSGCSCELAERGRASFWLACAALCVTLVARRTRPRSARTSE
jgi:hypothetical protein